jgi:hypothetical protein
MSFTTTKSIHEDIRKFADLKIQLPAARKMVEEARLNPMISGEMFMINYQQPLYDMEEQFDCLRIQLNGFKDWLVLELDKSDDTPITF